MKLGRTAISAMPKLSGSASAGAASVVLVKAVVAAHAEQPSDRGSRIDPNLNRTRRSQGACYAPKIGRSEGFSSLGTQATRLPIDAVGSGAG